MWSDLGVYFSVMVRDARATLLRWSPQSNCMPIPSVHLYSMRLGIILLVMPELCEVARSNTLTPAPGGFGASLLLESADIL